jgi:hypothetical protein
MRFLARVEEACAAIVERGFARMFPSRLDPAQIARKLVAVFEAAPPGTASFAISVAPVDFANLQRHRRYLEEQWTEMIAELARNLGIALAGAPAVRLCADSGVVAGSIRIEGTRESAARGAASFTLRVVRGMPPGGSFPVEREVLVGRGEEADVALADPLVSRRHARLVPLAGAVELTDEGSANGTFVNGERVVRAVVRAGDRIAFGDTEMVLEE